MLRIRGTTEYQDRHAYDMAWSVSLAVISHFSWSFSCDLIKICKSQGIQNSCGLQYRCWNGGVQSPRWPHKMLSLPVIWVHGIQPPMVSWLSECMQRRGRRQICCCSWGKEWVAALELCQLASRFSRSHRGLHTNWKKWNSGCSYLQISVQNWGNTTVELWGFRNQCVLAWDLQAEHIVWNIYYSESSGL